jgi:hypothetical protein
MFETRKTKRTATSEQLNANPIRNPTSTTSPRGTTTRTITVERRHSMIQEAAYLRAEKRGFQGGDPRQDWIEAEREIDTMLKNNVRTANADTN